MVPPVPRPLARAGLTWPAIGAAFVLAALAAAGTLALLSPGGSSGADANPLVLEPVPDVDPAAFEAEILTFAGESTNLATLLDGRPTVVNFFASTCAPCIHEMPAFEEVHQALGDRVAFIGLAHIDRPDDALAIVALTGVTYPTYRDQSGAVLNGLGGIGMPTTVLFAPDGTVVHVHTGALDVESLTSRIVEHLGVPFDG